MSEIVDFFFNGNNGTKLEIANPFGHRKCSSKSLTIKKIVCTHRNFGIFQVAMSSGVLDPLSQLDE